jgi:hypothetical protein
MVSKWVFSVLARVFCPRWPRGRLLLCPFGGVPRTASDLRSLLTERDITNSAAAVLAGVDRSTISLIVNGHRRASPQTVVRLARALAVDAMPRT